ncbi:sulfite exporter TauE/SafE family protein [Aliifodinibius sp. S!AR15-10]|uniref:cytochrome c biogenesis protein CcdA n=1 Tax=Aliifodinibius sp. S!AR15-10 TaxID=2950437 RepID=UPI002854FDD8|nr:sulfite exporter TauE/SafE family protein [Aliifodinibius sp. S!AR15-10]MDR8393632.1 sulfite exporter TauE/SafE family protein [Aliifodinibius sp. S!AR15-10]
MTTKHTETVEDSFLREYSTKKRLLWGFGIMALGIIIAGFWNYHLVDGFGKNIVAGNTIGNTESLAGTYNENGSGFGFIFAAIAGLAATFTACNCVAFAMIPGLACSTDKATTRQSAISAIIAFVTPVVLVGAAYGIFVGFLGPEGVSAINERPVRIAQAQAVFSIIGVAMIFWGFLELGFFKKLTQRFSPLTRQFFSSPTTKVALMGFLVGLFAVGRPFPVFRQFLAYAATAESPTYGAIVMAIHGLGQITVLLLLFFSLVYFAGERMMHWSTEKPNQPRMLTAMALLGGGAYFVFYWGLAFVYDIGRWGFKLGWY